MKAISDYARVSKKEQQRDGEAFTRQLWQLDRECKKYPDRERLHFQDIQSGRRDDRPDYQKLIQVIAEGRIDVLIVTRIDRIARDAETNAKIQKLLERNGVQLYEILLGRFLDWNNPHDWSYFIEAGVKAEGESRMLSARIKQTFEYHRAQGRFGGGQVGFPYRRSKEGFIEPDPEAWEIAVKLILIYLEENGARMRTIIRLREELKYEKTQNWLTRWLNSPLIRGHSPVNSRNKNGAWKDITDYDVVENTHVSLFSDPRLVGAEEQLAAILKANKRIKGAARSMQQYPLSGLLFCGRCGASCHIKKAVDKKRGYSYTYVVCSDRNFRGKNCGGDYGFHTSNRMVNTHYSEAEEAVIKAISARAKDLLALSKQEVIDQPKDTPQITALRNQIKNLEALKDNDLNDVIAKKTTQLNRLLLENSGNKIPNEKQELLLLQLANPNGWMLLSQSELTQTYRTLIKQILCDRSTVTVDLLF